MIVFTVIGAAVVLWTLALVVIVGALWVVNRVRGIDGAVPADFDDDPCRFDRWGTEPL